MTAFARQLDTAARLIAKNGALCTWRKPSVDTPTDTPWAPGAGSSPTDYPVRIVMTTSRLMSLFAMMVPAATDIPTGARTGIMAGKDLPFTPEYRDGILLPDNTMLYLKSFEPVAPDGTVLLYKLTMVE